MVLGGPIHNFEVQLLSPKVIQLAEDYVECDSAKGVYSLSWHDAMKTCLRRLEVSEQSVHVAERAGIDYVNATSSIHEHFAHLVVSDLSFEY
jgi:hypothetical protein